MYFLSIKTELIENQRMNVRQIPIRAQSKKEIYRLLQFVADVYLSSIHQANKKYTAEVVLGKMKVSSII